MTIITNVKTINHGRIKITIDYINHCEGSDIFHDLYTESEHIAGTTIATPNHLRNGPVRHYIGQCKPSELAREYAEQGRENPSEEAYSSLQKELAHCIQANNCHLEYTIYKNNIGLACVNGLCFETSPEYDELEDCNEIFKMEWSDIRHELFKQAKQVLKSLTE
jgi:hypothetical protein